MQTVGMEVSALQLLRWGTSEASALRLKSPFHSWNRYLCRAGRLGHLKVGYDLLVDSVVNKMSIF